MTDTATHFWNHFRWAMWGSAAFLLLLPLLAGAPWTASDYVAMALLLSVAGGAVEAGIRASGDGAYRLGVIVAAGAGFLLVWVNLAVGLLGDESNPGNFVFVGVLAVAIAGSIVARSNARLMARAMALTAAAQVAAGVIGYAAGLAAPGVVGVYEVTMGTVLFASLWAGSATLFLHSSRRARPANL